jgi:hypothetical protein
MFSYENEMEDSTRTDWNSDEVSRLGINSIQHTRPANSKRVSRVTASQCGARQRASVDNRATEGGNC